MRAFLALCLLAGAAFADTSPRPSLPPGVVASWSFSRTGSIDERTGKKIELVNGRIDKTGLRLEGGAYGIAKDPKIGAAGGSVSIEVWVKFDQLNRDWALLCMRGTLEKQIGETFGIYVGWQGQVYFNANRTSTQTPNAAIVAGEWTHVVCVVDKDDKTQKIYVNGREMVSVRAAEGGLVDKGGPTYVGGCDQHGYYVNGTMRQVRIHNRAISARDVERLSKAK